MTNKEINQAIAKHIFKFEQHPDYPHLFVASGHQSDPFVQCPDYCGDVRECEKVIKKMESQRMAFDICDGFIASFYSLLDADKTFQAKDANDLRAICLAALEVVK